MFPPERIICLTEETVETLYLLGEESRIVGISGYVVRPPRARREKSRVSAFTSADIPKILDLKPDLVLTFSDLQADIAAALIRAHVEVHAFNQRTITQILDMIRRSEHWSVQPTVPIDWRMNWRRLSASLVSAPRNCARSLRSILRSGTSR
jgi:ABC-type hemin transport system substrate-binding protein